MDKINKDLSGITGKDLKYLKSLLMVGDNCIVYDVKKRKETDKNEDTKMTGVILSLFDHHFCVQIYIKENPIIKSYKYVDLLIENPKIVVNQVREV